MRATQSHVQHRPPDAPGDRQQGLAPLPDRPGHQPGARVVPLPGAGGQADASPSCSCAHATARAGRRRHAVLAHVRARTHMLAARGPYRREPPTCTASSGRGAPGGHATHAHARTALARTTSANAAQRQCFPCPLPATPCAQALTGLASRSQRHAPLATKGTGASGHLRPRRVARLRQPVEANPIPCDGLHTTLTAPPPTGFSRTPRPPHLPSAPAVHRVAGECHSGRAPAAPAAPELDSGQ